MCQEDVGNADPKTEVRTSFLFLEIGMVRNFLEGLTC